MTHSFTLILSGPNPNDRENLDRLFEAGCDDAMFGERDGVYFADFDRETPSFSEALVSAMADIQRAVPGLFVVRVEPEPLVTAAEIAARTKRSRENIRQLFEGTRGPGGFPRPIAWLSDRIRVWHWSDVSQWFEACLGERFNAGTAHIMTAANALLTLQRFSPQKPSLGSSALRVVAPKDWDGLLRYLRSVERAHDTKPVVATQRPRSAGGRRKAQRR